MTDTHRDALLAARYAAQRLTSLLDDLLDNDLYLPCQDDPPGGAALVLSERIKDRLEEVNRTCRPLADYGRVEAIARRQRGGVPKDYRGRRPPRANDAPVLRVTLEWDRSPDAACRYIDTTPLLADGTRTIPPTN